MAARLGAVPLVLGALYSAPARASDIYSAALPALGVAERTVDGINTTRGTDMLIVYTPGTGRATTGTNQWGYEVVVEDGYVVAAGGNNSPIPQNGFVVSAHGASIPWLQENAPVGARVTLNGRELRITVDAESHKRLAAEVLRYTEEVLGTAWDMVPRASQDEVAHSMDRAQAALMDGEYGKAIQLAGEARFYGTPSLPVELRGIWHRPVERSPIAVRHTLDQLAAAGFNALFLETFYTGYTIYPSAIAPQRGEFVGWDPLQVWAEEAAARGIELHLWVHLFHLGRITVDMHPRLGQSTAGRVHRGRVGARALLRRPGPPRSAGVRVLGAAGNGRAVPRDGLAFGLRALSQHELLSEHIGIQSEGP